jgi:hypothetical protein
MAAAMTVAVACSGLLSGAGAAAAAARPASNVRGGPVGGTWGTAVRVPGLAALSVGGFAETESVSCAAPGDCSAGGTYTDGAHVGQAFVVTQADGRWGPAEEVPGTAALNQGGHYASVLTVSCAAPGDCSAGGLYEGSGFGAFVVSEVNGVWGRARAVTGLQGEGAQLFSVSCAAPGDCTAGGFYGVPNADTAFVVTQTNGSWGRAQQVPGIAALEKGGDARIKSVSCTAPGDCSAGGEYEARYSQQAFVVTQADGRWGRAQEVPGTAVLNHGGWAQVSSVSCAAPGECSAGGYYSQYRGGGTPGFVVDERHGVWGTAEPVTGPGAQEVWSVSCAAPGECSAVGDVYVVTEKHGAWGTAEQVPGLAALNTGADAGIDTVSCAAPGDCSAGGFYTNPDYQSFVVGQQHGVWGTAEEVRGTAETDGLWGELTSVSCAAPGDCSAGGYYDPKPPSSDTRAYLVSETAGRCS